MTAYRQLIALTSVLFSATTLLAHDLNTSYTTMVVSDTEAVVRLVFDQNDIEKVFDVDDDENGMVSREELMRHLDEYRSYYQSRLEMSMAGEDVQMQPGDGRVFSDELGNSFVELSFVAPAERAPWRLEISLDIFTDFGPRHKNLAKFRFRDEIQQAIFTAGTSRQTITFSGETTPLHQRILQFVYIGIEHIFIGYDHILFLIALVLVGGGLKTLVKIVTAFTVAHSVTLALAALEILQIPSRVVESAIALSIVVIAVENFFIKNSEQRWLVAGAFGLMHGFGFANVLTQLGLPSGSLVASLFSFNIGVELGQLAIIFVTYPVILFIARSQYRSQIVYAASAIILCIGLMWFLERALAINFGI